MENWGYIRVSTDRVNQGASYEDQADALTRAGATTIIREEASAGAHRPIFTKMIADASDRAETTGQPVNIHVTKLDRAFRDIEEAVRIVRRARRHHVTFTLHDLSPEPMDPSDPAKALQFHMLAAFAQFEKDRFAERRAVGIAKAKKEGKYKGRKPTARAKADDVLALRARGFKVREVATQLKIGEASVYRILANHRDATV